MTINVLIITDNMIIIAVISAAINIVGYDLKCRYKYSNKY